MSKGPTAKRRKGTKFAQRSKQQSPAVRADISRAFFDLCENVNTPHSLALWLTFKYDHEAFVDLQLDPKSYGDSRISSYNRHASPQAFAYDLLCQEYLSKYKGLKLAVDCKTAALQAFASSEDRMRIVNQNIKAFRSAQMPRLEAIISIARRKISEILGIRSDAHFEFGWGPGATFSISGDVAWDTKILEKRISVTASALPLAQLTVGADLHWCRARGIPSDAPCCLLTTEFDVVPGNRITTVPKNAKTDRTIAIEPTANIYLQKGIGTWIRERLRRIARIDLNSQLLNQQFARKLSYATIDLKAASDSISIEIIRLLLPEEWVFLLDVLRSPNYKIGDSWERYEKWSSMGNGYTFELETLVFYALSFATQSIKGDRPHAIVYGDDILVPVDHARDTIAVLDTFGFQTNLKKTHYESLYRESCGAHFFNQVLVTPVYQKEIPSHAEEVYHMANRLRLAAARLGGYHFSDKTLFSAWKSTLDSFTVKRPFYTALSFAELQHPIEPVNIALEGGLHLSIEDCESLGWPVFLYGTKHSLLCRVPKKRRFDPAAGLAYLFHSGSSLEGEDRLSLRGRYARQVRRKRLTSTFSSNVWL